VALGGVVDRLLLRLLLGARAGDEGAAGGIVYAICAGVGIVAAAVIGVAVFGERLGALQLLFIVLILTGAIGLRLTTSS
jgi:multidrug transporter EmrE-like cation transporter